MEEELLSVQIQTQSHAGQVIAQRYRVCEMIGVGGWGVVYRAEHLSLQKDVAVKIMHPNLCLEKENISRFTQEALTVAKLQHPGIASTYDCGTLASGQPYMVMELVEGTSLANLLRDQKCIDPLVACDLFRQACDALHHAHSNGIVHRDVKPSNFLLSGDAPSGYRLKLVDFGLAHLTDSGADITRTGQTVGTPAYMSPEQCRGQKVDSRSDVYSLACVFFEALTGVKAIDGSNMYEYMFNHIEHSPSAFPKFGNVQAENKNHEAVAVYAALEPVLLRGLAKNANDRFSSAAAFGEAIATAQRGTRNNIFSLAKARWHTSGKRTRVVILSMVALSVIALASYGFANPRAEITETAKSKWNSTQARLQKDLSDPWAEGKTIRSGEQIRVGGFHNGDGELANDVRLDVLGPQSFEKLKNPSFIHPTVPGTYKLRVTTPGYDDRRGQDQATFVVMPKS